MSFHPQRTDVYKPLAFKPRVRHPGLRREGLRQPPVALAADGRQDRRAFAGAECEQMTHLRSRTSPPFPVAERVNSFGPAVG